MSDTNYIYPTEISPTKKDLKQVVCLLEKGEFYQTIEDLFSAAGYHTFSKEELGRHLTYEADGIYFANMRKAEGIERLSMGVVDCALLTGAKALDLVLAKKIDWKARNPFERWVDGKSDIMILSEYKLTGGRFAFMALSDLAEQQPQVWSYSIKTVSSPYPTIAEKELVKLGIKAKVIFSSGSTEVDPLIGAADAVFDEVIGGETARQNGLKIFKTYASSLKYGNIPLVFVAKRASWENPVKKPIIEEIKNRLNTAYQKVINGEIKINLNRDNARGDVPLNFNNTLSPREVLKGLISKTAIIEEPAPKKVYTK